MEPIHTFTVANEADKTSLIHFTKRAKADDTRAIRFNNITVLPQQTVKVLGVTLDKKLAMDEHLSRVINKGTRACLSLQAIKGTRPAQMRQLFRSCVLPITDYAASAWYGPGKVGVVRLANALEEVQRLGARLITRAWNKVVLPVLEAEACLGTPRERLERKVSIHVAKLISLPKSNPAKEALLHGINVAIQGPPFGASNERIQATYGESAMDPRAIDRPQYSSSHQGKGSGSQRHSHNRRGGYRGPLHRCISREAADRHRSRPENRDTYLGRQAGFDRLGIYVWGVKCGDNSDSSCSRVRSGASHTGSTASGVLRQPAGSQSNPS